MNRPLADEVKSQALVIEKLTHQLAGQNRHRFGVRSESLDQLRLTFEEDEAIAEAAEEQAKPDTPPAEGKAPRQHGRKPFPDHLDRHDQVLSPGEDRTRRGGRLKTLGEDITEELGACAWPFRREPDRSPPQSLRRLRRNRPILTTVTPD